MKPWKHLGTAQIPNNGGELKLSQREQEFSIRLSGLQGELMNSRRFSSEEALAELGCAHLSSAEQAQVLVGGMGMGFTLAAALKTLPTTAQVTVAELIPEVIQWNQGSLGDCAGQPLQDSRIQVHLGDVAELLIKERHAFDAILLDVDNGPEGITHTNNNWLYSTDGLNALYETLRPEGMLAIWSAGSDSLFTIQLKKAGFKVEIRTVRAHAGKGSRHTIFLARKPWRSNS